MEFATPHVWLAAMEVIAINILLSADNAVVIALACRNLPAGQRTLGIVWGVIAVVVLRILLTVFAVTLLTLPYLQLAGAALLVWIGIGLVSDEDRGERDRSVHASDRLVAAVWTVVVADLVMSLDNVIGVAGAARGSLVALVIGLAISIPLVIAGSRLIIKAIERFPVIVIAGGGLLGCIAGEIAVADVAVNPWVELNLPQLSHVAPVAGIVVVVSIGTWLSQRTAVARVERSETRVDTH